MDRRSLLLAIAASIALGTASEAQRFDPRGDFDDAGRGRGREDRSFDDRSDRGDFGNRFDGRGDADEARLSHDQLRAIVARQYAVREMRTSGECGREFWALIITNEGHAQWIVLDVRDGRFLRSQSYAPSCR